MGYFVTPIIIYMIKPYFCIMYSYFYYILLLLLSMLTHPSDNTQCIEGTINLC